MKIKDITMMFQLFRIINHSFLTFLLLLNSFHPCRWLETIWKRICALKTLNRLSREIIEKIKRPQKTCDCLLLLLLLLLRRRPRGSHRPPILLPLKQTSRRHWRGTVPCSVFFGIRIRCIIHVAVVYTVYYILYIVRS